MKVLKILALIVGALIVAVLGSDLFFRYYNPFPPLAAGLPDKNGEAERELNERVKAQFPLGSSEAALRAALMQEGWGEVQTHNGQGYVRFTRSFSLIMQQTAAIAWRVDEQGRLTDIKASYGLIAP